MEPTIVYNATSSGLMNLGNHSSTIGIGMGAGFLLMFVALPIAMHYVLKYQKQLRWFWDAGVENFLYGIWTVVVSMGIKLGWDFFTDERNVAGAHDVFLFILTILSGIVFIGVVGFVSKGGWKFLYEYVFVRSKKK